MFSPSLFYDFKEGFKPISNFQNMIDDDDNSLIAIAIVAFVRCANAGDWSFNTYFAKLLAAISISKKSVIAAIC